MCKYVLVPVSSYGNTFIDAVCGARDDVVQLVGHSPRARHIRNTARTVKFGSQDVVQHTACVANFKTAWFDATNLRDRKQLVSNELVPLKMNSVYCCT